MQSTYPTQHCGCDFCSSRRSVNAKKLAVSQAIAQKRGGCSCECHSRGGSQGGERGFDPDYPAPVNQTALNASRGRNGVSGGNQYTIQNTSTRAGGSGAQVDSSAYPKETAEQRQVREMAELNALERLLIAEYKARTRATMEADRLLATAARRPQPLPEGYTEGSQGNNGNSGGFGEPGTWGRSRGSVGQNVSTIHEAYAMAQECPVTPPAQCHASHRLQDTMDDVRKVTGDPINSGNRRALQRLLNKNGVGSGGENGGSETSSMRGDATNKNNNGSGSKADKSAFGSSLAQIRTNNMHPRGAGVVWVAAAPAQSSSKDTSVLMVDNAASSSAKRPSPLSPNEATANAAAALPQSASEHHVSYAA